MGRVWKMLEVRVETEGVDGGLVVLGKPRAEMQMSYGTEQTSWPAGIQSNRHRRCAWPFYGECRAVLVCRMAKSGLLEFWRMMVEKKVWTRVSNFDGTVLANDFALIQVSGCRYHSERK